eukprot:9738745-Lingulodinium_polyedra.AAC.1
MKRVRYACLEDLNALVRKQNVLGYALRNLERAIRSPWRTRTLTPNAPALRGAVRLGLGDEPEL